MLHIDGQRCSLRALEPSDIEMLYIWENDPEVWRVSGTLAPISLERIARFIEEQNYDIYASRQMRLIVEVESVAVGTIDIFDFDPHNQRFGIGILIYSQEERCKGYARAAIEAMVEYGREVLGVKQVWASVAEDNTPSIALFERCGFERCGLRKAWLRRGNNYINEIEYQLIIR